MNNLATYTLSVNGKGEYVVIIDLGDGFREDCTRQSLEGVIALIEESKQKYDNERQFKAVFGLYQGALDFLNENVVRCSGNGGNEQ